MTINPAFERFKEEFPEVGKVFGQLYQTVSSKALDEKTKQLVYLGVLATARYSPAIKVHIRRAIDAGANKDEILESLMLSIPASGICHFLDILPEVLDELNNQD
jgi:alkylhydroperoxidase/carboxymuconolactone decarboxylase family protein YurZ